MKFAVRASVLALCGQMILSVPAMAAGKVPCTDVLDETTPTVFE